MKIEGVKSFTVAQLFLIPPSQDVVRIDLKCINKDAASKLYDELNKSCKNGEFSLKFEVEKKNVQSD